MSNIFRVEIITPDKAPIVYDIESLQTSTLDGEVEFKINHTPIILSTIPTVTTITKVGGEKIKCFTSTGIVYIKNNVIKFCCDTVETPDSINVSRAKEAKKRAEERLQESNGVDIDRAKLALARANARIKTVSMNQ